MSKSQESKKLLDSEFEVDEKIELEWKNISLNTKIKEASLNILNNVSGSASPNEITAIMGESGSGKTSLLSILSGTLDIQGGYEATGSITQNGIGSNDIKRSKYIRFIDQDVILYETMTPYEFLYFRLKLTSKESSKVIEKQVQSFLKRFGLLHVAFSPIGGKSFRGLSGGERRRVAIAAELIWCPSVLILDEPTSGLDSFMAKKVVEILKEFKESGVTIILSIHQPGHEIFSMIDKLILMQKGQFVYQGSVQASINYFANIGFEVPTFMNPPDYFMRVLHIQDKNNLTDQEQHDMKILRDAYEKHHKSSRRTNSMLFPESFQEQDKEVSFFTLVKLLFWREFINFRRNPFNSKMKLAEIVFFTILNILIYYDLDVDSRGIENRRGFIVRILITCAMIPIYTLVITIAHERLIVAKELEDGLYSIQSYLTVKILSEIPVMILASSIIALVPYPFVNMNHEHDYKIWVFFLINLNCYLQGILIGCLGGAISINPVTAIKIGIALLNSSIIFSGFYSDPEAPPDAISWMRFLSPLYFLRDAAYRNEFEDLDYDDDVDVSPKEKFNYNREISTNLLISLSHMACIYILSCVILRLRLKKNISLINKFTYKQN